MYSQILTFLCRIRTNVPQKNRFLRSAVDFLRSSIFEFFAEDFRTRLRTVYFDRYESDAGGDVFNLSYYQIDVRLQRSLLPEKISKGMFSTDLGKQQAF